MPARPPARAGTEIKTFKVPTEHLKLLIRIGCHFSKCCSVCYGGRFGKVLAIDIIILGLQEHNMIYGILPSSYLPGVKLAHLSTSDILHQQRAPSIPQYILDRFFYFFGNYDTNLTLLELDSYKSDIFTELDMWRLPQHMVLCIKLKKHNFFFKIFLILTAHEKVIFYVNYTAKLRSIVTILTKCSENIQLGKILLISLAYYINHTTVLQYQQNNSNAQIAVNYLS